MKDNQLAKLIKKNVEKVEKAQSKKSKFLDPTLTATQRPNTTGKDDDTDIERTAFFKEMKRRSSESVNRLFAFLGATAGGYAGWAIGAPAGPFTAYVVSTVGTGVGIYVARRIARELGG